MTSYMLKGIAPLFIALGLAACAKPTLAPRTIDMSLRGQYRAMVPSGESGASIDSGDTQTALNLNLSQNGRFSISAARNGCQVSEDLGFWEGTPDSITLVVKRSQRRADCGSKWYIRGGETALVCPIRAMGGRTFQVLHGGIRHGTEWVAFEKTNPKVPFPELIGMDGDGELASLNNADEKRIAGPN